MSLHLFHSRCYRIGVFQGTNLRINFKKKEKTYQKFLLFRTILVISHSISEIEFDGLCHFSMFDVPIIIMNGTHPNSIIIPLSQWLTEKGRHMLSQTKTHLTDIPFEGVSRICIRCGGKALHSFRIYPPPLFSSTNMIVQKSTLLKIWHLTEKSCFL